MAGPGKDQDAGTFDPSEFSETEDVETEEEVDPEFDPGPDNAITDADFGPEDDDDEDPDGEEPGEDEPEGEEEPEGDGEEPGEEEPGTEETETPPEAAELSDDSKVTLKIDEKEKEFSFGEVKKLAQRAATADDRFQMASVQVKQAMKVIEAVTHDPLSAYYHLMVQEHGDEKAYAMTLKHAQTLVGKELDFQQLPEEERIKRQSETAMARKDREIERLRKEKQDRESRQKGELVAAEIYRKAAEAGFTSEADVWNIGGIYDMHAASGSPKSIEECVEEHRQNVERHLQGLPDDDLKRFGFARNGQPGKKTTVPKVPVKRTSTKKARPRKKHPKDPGTYKNFDEARYWARRTKAKT